MCEYQKVSKDKKNHELPKKIHIYDYVLESKLKECISNLPEKWNLAISYKYFSNQKTEVICQELGITTSNYWQIIHRAKLLLKKCVESKWYILENFYHIYCILVKEYPPLSVLIRRNALKKNSWYWNTTNWFAKRVIIINTKTIWLKIHFLPRIKILLFYPKKKKQQSLLH